MPGNSRCTPGDPQYADKAGAGKKCPPVYRGGYGAVPVDPGGGLQDKTGFI